MGLFQKQKTEGMKYLLTIILMFAIWSANAQEFRKKILSSGGSYKIAEKHYEDKSGEYAITYRFNDETYFVAATYPPSEPHYYAEIMVYKLKPCDCDCHSDNERAIHFIACCIHGVMRVAVAPQKSPESTANDMKAAQYEKTIEIIQAAGDIHRGMVQDSIDNQKVK